MREALARFWDGDLAWSWRHSPVAVCATAMLLLMVVSAFGARWIAPYDPFDLATIDLSDALKPPVWLADGTSKYWLGTDSQGRDMLSALMYGTRVSLLIGMAAVAGAMTIGIVLGLVSGYLGGRIDALIMRIADVQLSFPAILIALLIDGVARAVVPGDMHEVIAFPVLVIAIALAGWPQYARTVRGSTLVDNNREATLSFLGVGVPATSPSLGTLIRIGNDFLFSGEWWITIFPGAALVLLVLSVNLLGDWLRDALNPRLA